MEINDEMWGKVSKSTGLKIFTLLGGDPTQILGIGVEGNIPEFWLNQEANTADMKLGGMTIQVEARVIIKKVSAFGQRRQRLILKEFHFQS